MRIICMSDSHSKHNDLSYNPEDFINENDENILIHSGDCTNIGTDQEISDFIDWYSGLKMFDKKIFIAGNHDFGFEKINRYPYHSNQIPEVVLMTNPEILDESDVVYLEDDEYVFKSVTLKRKIKFYGSPWQPEFYDWAFNLPINGEKLRSKWEMIPKDTDILLTHGPAYGLLDLTPDIRSVGCGLLRERINKVQPLLHNFGHIHHSYGETFHNGTLHVNSSVCNERYVPKNKPIVVDLTLGDNGQILINGDTWN